MTRTTNTISRDEIKKRSDEDIKSLVSSLFVKMTLEEKVGQLHLSAFSHEYAFGPDFKKNNSFELIQSGRVGMFVGPYDNNIAYELQETAIKDTRLGIPLLFANDIIHGCRTGFPINIALSGMFHPELLERVARSIAFETSHSGTNVTLSPMLDIVRDPRWGRVMESPGEDPYLASVMATSYVKGYQQDNLLSYDSIGTCLKHYVGYGQAEAGRDYNTVDMSERTLRQVYLKPFEAGIEAGALMVMSAFNVYDGVPISANAFLLRDVLREEMGFTGVTISDYASTEELVEHKIARTKKEAAQLCVKAGLDVEIITTSYIDTLEDSAQNDPELMAAIDEAVIRILTLKYKLGLFDNPFKNIYPNFTDYYLLDETLAVAEQAAKESLVLLKNTGVLPLEATANIGLFGPFATTHDVVGGWGGKARNEDTIPLLDGLQELGLNVSYSLGANIKDTSEKLLEEALAVATKQDVLLVTLGEHQWESGEASSKTNLDVHPAQMNLLRTLASTGKPIVTIVFSGRPLMMGEIDELSDAVIYSWFLGTTSGSALAKTLVGDSNPSGRLAMTFPRSVGQIPLYYNHLPTGRPAIDPKNYYTSKYLDLPNDPMYPFGYGLSYSTFSYDDMSLDKTVLKEHDVLHIEVTITNTSNHPGMEVVQLYIEALSFSVSRPVNELKGFQKVWIDAKETKTVQLVLDYRDLAYWNIENTLAVEQRDYKIKVGSSSATIHHEATITTE